MDTKNILDVRRRISRSRTVVFEALMAQGQKENLSINELILVVAGILNQLAVDGVTVENTSSSTSSTAEESDEIRPAEVRGGVGGV